MPMHARAYTPTDVGFGRFELSQRHGARWTGANSYLAVG